MPKARKNKSMPKKQAMRKSSPNKRVKRKKGAGGNRGVGGGY